MNRIRKIRSLLLMSALMVLVLICEHSLAEMYKWIDEKGTIHFTDDLSKIPDKYRPLTPPKKPEIIRKEQNILEEFLDLKWGASADEFTGLTGEPVIKAAGIMVGVRKVTDIGGIKTYGADYRFYKNRYYSCVIKAADLEQGLLFKDALISKYGDPKVIPYVMEIAPHDIMGEEYIWVISGRVRITVTLHTRGPLRGNIYLNYTYLPIEKEQKKEEKKSIFDKTKNKL